jgi:hypothetical protein
MKTRVKMTSKPELFSGKVLKYVNEHLAKDHHGHVIWRSMKNLRQIKTKKKLKPIFLISFINYTRDFKPG